MLRIPIEEARKVPFTHAPLTRGVVLARALHSAIRLRVLRNRRSRDDDKRGREGCPGAGAGPKDGSGLGRLCAFGEGEKRGGAPERNSALADCGGRHSWPRVNSRIFSVRCVYYMDPQKQLPERWAAGTGNGNWYPVAAQHSFSAVLDARVCVYTRSAIPRSPAPREFPGKGFPTPFFHPGSHPRRVRATPQGENRSISEIWKAVAQFGNGRESRGRVE